MAFTCFIGWRYCPQIQRDVRRVSEQQRSDRRTGCGQIWRLENCRT